MRFIFNVMIINPVKLPVSLYPYYWQNHISKNNVLSLPNQNDKVEFSFTGIFESSEIPIHLEKAQQYSGIHCPSCGTPMLSSQDFECILEKSAQAKNAKELIELFRTNRKFVPQRFGQIFEDIDDISDTEEMSVAKFREIMSQHAYLRKKQTTDSIKNYLRECTLILPPDIQEKALKTVDEIRTKQIFQVQRKKIIQFAKDMELNDAQTNIILSKTLKPLFIANGYFMLFNSSKLSQIPENEYGKYIAERLFCPSVNTVSRISKFSNHANLENNKLLMCSGCNQNQPKNVFWKSQNYREIKDNIRSYLTDISYLMGEEKMEYSPHYIGAFAQITGNLSRQTIQFSPNEIKAIKNVGRSIYSHEHFAPIEQTEVDIPCAECGSVMLPHAKRKEIEKELKNCNTPFEYSQVLQKNIKYIGKNYKVLAKIFLRIVHEQPNITNEECVEKFIKEEANYSNKGILNAMEKYLDDRDYVKENFPPESFKIYETFGKRMVKYIDEGKFSDYNIPALYEACMKDLDIKNYPVRPIYMFMRHLRTISYKHMCATFDKKLDFNDKDPVYTILFNLFKSNVATADHLMACHNGGSGNKYNLIGLCKSCNKTKSRKNVLNWYTENKQLKQNLEKQLRVINNMAESGQLEGYDDWAKIIANKVYEQTNGRLDLREDF